MASVNDNPIIDVPKSILEVVVIATCNWGQGKILKTGVSSPTQLGPGQALQTSPYNHANASGSVKTARTRHFKFSEEKTVKTYPR